MDFIQLINRSRTQAKIPDKIYHILSQLYVTYRASIEEEGLSMAPHEATFSFLLDRVEEQLISPYSFEPYHQKITSPLNYEKFALDFTRPLVDFENSKLVHPKHVLQIDKQIKKKDNVILFANHQTEVDPQLIHLMIKDLAPELASTMIFVAGDRVLTDPVAAPFSMGCNLICIYSKRHIDHPPEKKAEKQLHNQKTMRRLVELFAEGGKCIYVAPAGGRDRPNQEDVVELAEFDPQSIEMFRLMAQKSKSVVHFYPLALSTYHILPPPKQIQSELGERRKTSRHKVMLSFGAEIDMDKIGDLEENDRHQAREMRANAIFHMVKQEYKNFNV